jgi:hypothetical protein
LQDNVGKSRIKEKSKIKKVIGLITPDAATSEGNHPHTKQNPKTQKSNSRDSIPQSSKMIKQYLNIFGVGVSDKAIAGMKGDLGLWLLLLLARKNTKNIKRFPASMK